MVRDASNGQDASQSLRKKNMHLRALIKIKWVRWVHLRAPPHIGGAGPGEPRAGQPKREHFA